MKRQLKSLVRGIIVGALIGLFIVYGGPAYVASILQSSPEPVPDPVELEILTPILAPATTTATTSAEATVETATTTATSTDETAEGASAAYEDIEAVLGAVQTIFAKEPTNSGSQLSNWFSNTKLSVLSNPYTLTTSGEQFCIEHESVLNNLSIRHSDRISLERDQLASAIDEYSAIRSALTDDITTQQAAESAEVNLLLEVLDQLARDRFGGDKYIAIGSTTRETQDSYIQIVNDTTDTHFRALRIERDRLSNTLSNSIDSFDKSVADAIERTKVACTDNSANSVEILLTFEQDLRQAREEVQSSKTSDIQQAVAQAHANYKSKLQTAHILRLNAFETIR